VGGNSSEKCEWIKFRVKEFGDVWSLVSERKALPEVVFTILGKRPVAEGARCRLSYEGTCAVGCEGRCTYEPLDARSK